MSGFSSLDIFPSFKILQDHHLKSTFQVKALRDQYENTKGYEHVFISSRKQPFYSHDVIGVNFKRILNAAGVKARVLYNLRHTFASQLIAKGADIVWVSKMLGHEDVSITLQIYTKFIEEDDEIRLKKIEKMGTVFSQRVQAQGAHSKMRAFEMPNIRGL